MYGVHSVDGWFMHHLLDITGVAVAVEIFIRIYMYNSNCSIKKLVYASMEQMKEMAHTLTHIQDIKANVLV